MDSLADRLVFREFANDNFNLNEIFQMNNPDILADSAILGALITSCDFIYICKGEDDYPELHVIDGANATGIVDPTTGLLFEGYAVLERDGANDPNGAPILEAYFEPGRTTYYRAGEAPEVIENKVEYPLLVPIINRPDAHRPFGHSQISRACMKLSQAAVRTVFRSEVSAEFYSFPQKYVIGLSDDAEPLEKWRASISSMLDFRKDEDGGVPSVGQFSQQSMAPYMEQLQTLASLFAGETGLTLDDLGFLQSNPSSAESIKASHERLRLRARKAQRTFGSGLLNVGFVAACLRDDFPYQRRMVYLTTPKWEPIFEPDAAQLSGIGDAMNKLQQSFPDYLTEEKLRDMTGF